MTLDDAIQYCEEQAMSKMRSVAGGKFETGSEEEPRNIEEASKLFSIAYWLKKYRKVINNDANG